MANPPIDQDASGPDAGKPHTDQVQGEGDYVSARKFQKEQASFAHSGQVEPKAREAEQALDGPEGAELEQAREETAKGNPRH